jgi:eukaryotic-like serine/threonine-protein kinase
MTAMTERFPEAEVVLDDELMYDEVSRHYDDVSRPSSMLRHEAVRTDAIVREGDLLAGKYRVERIPGRNGLGIVVQVRHLELGQEVTLKFLVPDACAYPEFVQRFVREARNAVKIQGEHVARVTDVGRLESGAPYMVREYLRGPDLAEVVKVRGPLPVDEAVDYIIQACEGVAEGHALGVVHRNIRPTTLVVTRRSDGLPLVKVFDFAAAESLHIDPFTERAISLVGTSAIMASLPYLPPEQVRDPHDVDLRADVYSLGAVLYELLTGRPVYSAESAPALLAMVAADVAQPMRNFRPDLPGELEHIVLRCLAKNRALRYTTLADLVLALREFASSETTASIAHVVRLAKRTSRPSESRPPASSQPTATGSSSFAGSSHHVAARAVSSPAAPEAPFPRAPSAAPRGPTGTVILQHGVEATRSTARQIHQVGNDDVTTINPYSSYSVAAAAPVIVEPSRHTPPPPPPRTSVPPPLRNATPVPPPLSTRAEARFESRPAPLPRASAAQQPQSYAQPSAMAPSSVPPARSSIAGLSRSWAVADEPQSAPLFTNKRLLTVGVVAAFATLGAVLALRTGSARTGPAAAARPTEAKQAAPAAPPVAPPPPAPVAPPPVASAPAASATPASTPSAPPPDQVLALQQAVAALQAQASAARPTAAVAAPAALRAPAPAAVAPRKPAPAPARAPRPSSDEPAVSEKVARSRPALGPDLFDDPR